MIAAPTFNQIKAQVSAIAQHSSSSTVIGIHAKGRWSGLCKQTDGDKTYLISQCDSPLALRIALQNSTELQSDKKQNTFQVIITPLEDRALSEDILIRLAKQRLFPIDPWQIVKSLFRATNIDPRLTTHRWIPEALMDWMPDNRYAPVLGGFLDAEVVWPLLLQHGLAIETERPDLSALLVWSTDPNHIERYQKASEDFRIAASDWLTLYAGLATATLLNSIYYNPLPDALPLGLALEVICHPQAENQLEKAIGKLEERFLAGHTPEPHTLKAWSKAAQQALLTFPVSVQKSLIQRSDNILREIGADAFISLSTFSEQGFSQHLTTLSKHLMAVIKKPNKKTLATLTKTYRTVKAHAQAQYYLPPRRLERLDMALRLAQWLVANESQAAATPPKDLEDAIAQYTQSGSFLDWARYTLPIAEPHRDLASAYSRLFELITQHRETQSRQFATLLQNWTALGSSRHSILPVENILETVVAPLAEHNPVLLIVLDGMSLAITNELLTDLTQQSWHLIADKARPLSTQAGLAAIPSVTNVSRASLLSGQLTTGEQSQETRGFTKHPALVKQCKRNHPPLLFHKKGLQEVDTPNLSETLYGAISSNKNQVVGLVINAVDDLLNKGEQVDIAWTCDRIKVLAPILEAAQIAERLVIITSDHGHILHYSTEYQVSKGGGERWRKDNGKPNNRELKVSGDRVLAGTSSSVIAPWSERIRYSTAKRKGYHGGLTPQEMIVPVSVLAPTRICPKNSQPMPLQTPHWWSITAEATGENHSLARSENVSAQETFGPLFSSVF
ncbi:MAG: BREX-2 system phosphatase PglZ [Phormidesmis sp.]